MDTVLKVLLIILIIAAVIVLFPFIAAGVVWIITFFGTLFAAITWSVAFYIIAGLIFLGLLIYIIFG